MILSEKASAFFIENLISKKSDACSKSSKLADKSALNIGNFPTSDTAISAFISYSPKSSSSSSLSSVLSSPLLNELSKSTDTSYISRKYLLKVISKKLFKIENSLPFTAQDEKKQSLSKSPFKYNKKKLLKMSPEFPEGRAQTQSYPSSNCSSPRSLSPTCSPKQLDNGYKRKKADRSPDYFESTTTMTKALIETCKGNDKKLNKIECFLETDDLWKRFHELGTEMIITKSGRRMFPPLRVSFGGAELNDKYLIAMDIIPTDSKRYRYAYHRSSWLVAGKADPPVQSRLFIHPDGPFTGEALFKQIISFEKVKLTNNEMDKCGHVIILILIFDLINEF